MCPKITSNFQQSRDILSQDQDIDVELRDLLVASRLIESTGDSLPRGS